MSDARAVHRYHDGTKHQFTRFARSLGYLDWASQPNPFRSFRGAPTIPHSSLLNQSLLNKSAISNQQSAIGDVLRHSLGLSAWKQFRQARWSLRVNPSSGNLHPTEAYIVAACGGSADGTGAADGVVWHYAADRHALEQRCAFAGAAWRETTVDPSAFLVALTSIHWREAWKYGERAFRYCQHDLGHAIAAVRIAAALNGLDARMLPSWSHEDIAALTGIDRDEDYVDAEREEPGCVILVSRKAHVASRRSVASQPVASQSQVTGDSRVGGRELQFVSREPLISAVRAGTWSGLASQLSEDHVQWTFIDEIAAATRDPGHAALSSSDAGDVPAVVAPRRRRDIDRPLILQRRSALAFDGVSSIAAGDFFEILARAMPSAAPPWDALWWDARIHFALFVHRVDDVEPGLYMLVRNARAFDRLRASCGRDFLWTAAHDALPFYLLARGDCRAIACRLSCDQDIAADGFFSLGMLADFDASLAECGPSFYRHLFWESGVAGQVLYLEAEAAGGRATGIGCFYDDGVHDLLGMRDHAFQSLYHFTIGMPVEDARLTTEPGYEWEQAGP